MANGKRILRLTAIVIALAGVLGFQLEAMGMFGAEKAAGRPDAIMIDTIARLESLEQPAVAFDHDAHTNAQRLGRRERLDLAFVCPDLGRARAGHIGLDPLAVASARHHPCSDVEQVW